MTHDPHKGAPTLEMREALSGCPHCDYDEADGIIIDHCDKCCRRIAAAAWDMFIRDYDAAQAQESPAGSALVEINGLVHDLESVATKCGPKGYCSYPIHALLLNCAATLRSLDQAQESSAECSESASATRKDAGAASHTGADFKASDSEPSPTTKHSYAQLVARLRKPKSSLPFGDTRDIEAAEAADMLESLSRELAEARADARRKALNDAIKVCDNLVIEHVGNSALTLDQCAEAIRTLAAERKETEG